MVRFIKFLLNLSLNPLYSLLVLIYLNFLSYPLLHLIFLFNLKWIPELRDRSLWELIINSYYRKKYHFDYSMMETFSSCLPSSDDNSENTVVLNFLKDFSNFLENDALCKTECFQINNDNNNMNIYSPSIDNVEQEPHQRILSHRLSNNSSTTNTTNNGYNIKQSSIQLLISVCRVQQLVNSLLLTRMKTPLARTVSSVVLNILIMMRFSFFS